MLGIDPGVTYTFGVMLGRLCGHRASPAQRTHSLAVAGAASSTSRTPVVKMKRNTRGADPVGKFPENRKYHRFSKCFVCHENCTGYALRVLEVELVAPVTASECVRYAGEARWPQRRPSMTPDVYVTPGSIPSTQRPAK